MLYACVHVQVVALRGVALVIGAVAGLAADCCTY
jgi:hypothetical protein